ncbi:hypothetical protein [Nocardia shimofusensis]|uniref:hypothetical protein n=1 Tax=Nocardia shimofusensis TaxID=228596 RepID=UPI000A04BEC5|nr:hypothetical protein [Nocardia shimofusensis]
MILDDLTTVDLPTLRSRPLTPAARLTLVLHEIAAGNRTLGEDLTSWLGDLQDPAAPGGLDDLQSLVTYIFLVGETSEDDLGPVIDKLGPRAKEVIMTTAERLRAEGRAEGRTEARTEGHVEVLLGQLSTKFGPIPAHIRDRIRSADVAHLLTWSQRLLTASTLDEVFSEKA